MNWQVQQAYPVEKYPHEPYQWFSASEKLNGVRATFYRGQMIGRSGKVISGLDHIIAELSAIDLATVFDGELTLAIRAGKTDNEAFREATGIINSKNKQKNEICFTIFDMLPANEFDSGKSKEGYRMRSKHLAELSKKVNGFSVKVLSSLYSGNDGTVISPLLDQMVTQDKEGLMINYDVPYQRKRHNGILKVKRFYTMDLPVIGCTKGAGRLQDTLGALIVDYKGTMVNVGTGFDDELREWIWNHQTDIIGTLIEVKYKEISFNKRTKAHNLQFPVFVGPRQDKHDISYG